MNIRNEKKINNLTKSWRAEENVAQIVASYASNNKLTTKQLFDLMRMVYRSLKSINSKGTIPLESPTEPAVPIEESIQPDYLVCLEDGRRMKLLKRHLKTAYNMTPDDYRTRWNLPSNYPMVAPNYAKKRKKIAKKIGLGKFHKKAA